MSTDPMVGDTQQIAGGAQLVIQPGVGHVWKITALSTSNNAAIQYRLVGAVNSNVGMATVNASDKPDYMHLAIPVDNDDYMDINNSTGGAIPFGFRGWIVV